LGQLIRRYGAEFLKRWPQCPHVRQTLQDLALCRTPELGGHVTQCDHCGEVRYHYHSCGNRNCPQCGGTKRAAWLAKCQADLLPVPYFHVVFTLPHELSALALGNRELLYRLLFDSAKETLLEVAADPKHLGARIGVLMVLHTWGQKLEHHPHVHCVVPGGGLAVPVRTSGDAATVPGDQAPRWVSCRPNWFLPVQVLGQVFRGKYLAALRAAYEAGQLQFAGTTLPLANPTAFATWIRALYQKDWVVFAKEPFGGPEQVLKYLTGYTHRVALSNHRLVKLQDDRVTFTWKDYADGCKRKEMTLEAVEFVRRFTLHIIPKGLVRIRRYGLLAHRDRGERLALCRSLLATPAGSTMDQETDSPRPSPSGGSTASDQTAKGVEQLAPLIDPKTTSPSPMTSFIVLLLVLLVASGDISSFISSPTEPPLVVIIEDQCPSCGVGRLQTIWRAARPGHEARQQIPILDSS
jgi:Putative transposase/Transposase zinc-binding domain